jgi:hypothetical protein
MQTLVFFLSREKIVPLVVAGPPLCRDGAQRRQRHRLLQHCRCVRRLN